MLVLAITFGILLGWFLHLIYGNVNCKIAYVSQKEILALEKHRVEQNKEKSLFNGDTDNALKLIKKEALKFQNKYVKVIFVDDFVVGEDVYSISKVVHDQVIKQ